MSTAIFALRAKIHGGATSIPPPMVGAYVVAFSAADDLATAGKQILKKLEEMGFVVEEFGAEGAIVPLEDWDSYIAGRWPEFIDHFPAQAAVPDHLANGGVILGPFAGFEA